MYMCTISVDQSLLQRATRKLCKAAPKTTTKKNNFTIQIAGPPVEVGVTMYVLSISSLSEVKMVHGYLAIAFNAQYARYYTYSSLNNMKIYHTPQNHVSLLCYT